MRYKKVIFLFLYNKIEIIWKYWTKIGQKGRTCFFPDLIKALINTPYVTTVHFNPIPGKENNIEEKDTHTEIKGQTKDRDMQSVEFSGHSLCI